MKQICDFPFLIARCLSTLKKFSNPTKIGTFEGNYNYSLHSEEIRV
jgi:hypothetical protein